MPIPNFDGVVHNLEVISQERRPCGSSGCTPYNSNHTMGASAVCQSCKRLSMNNVSCINNSSYRAYSVSPLRWFSVVDEFPHLSMHYHKNAVQLPLIGSAPS